MSLRRSPRKCLHCTSLFFPDRRNSHHQVYCAQPVCRAVSKRESQRRWLSKEPNRSYFKGSAAVERVRAWRARHPGYSRGRKKKSPRALQDLCPPQQPPVEPLSPASPQDLFSGALQDLCKVQLPLIVGLLSQTLGSALQEDIVDHASRLIAKGQDLLDAPSRRSKSKLHSHGSDRKSTRLNSSH